MSGPKWVVHVVNKQRTGCEKAKCRSVAFDLYNSSWGASKKIKKVPVLSDGFRFFGQGYRYDFFRRPSVDAPWTNMFGPPWTGMFGPHTLWPPSCVTLNLERLPKPPGLLQQCDQRVFWIHGLWMHVHRFAMSACAIECEEKKPTWRASQEHIILSLSYKNQKKEQRSQKLVLRLLWMSSWSKLITKRKETLIQKHVTKARFEASFLQDLMDSMAGSERIGFFQLSQRSGPWPLEAHGSSS